MINGDLLTTLDVGNREDYERADQEFDARREAFLAGPQRPGPRGG